MVSPREDVLDGVSSDQLQHRQSPNSGSQASQIIPVGDIHGSQSDQDESTPLIALKNEPLEPDTGHLLQSDQAGIISSEKASQTTNSIHASQSGHEGSTPSTIREKVSEDGYNWRKYGQKLVKGNEFIRSYYKCTHPKCLVKKQLDCTHEGHITDIIYFGQHDHPKLPNLPVAVGFVVSIVEERPDDSSLSVSKDKSLDAHGQTPHQIEPTDNPRLSVAANDDVKGPLLQPNRIKDEVDNDDRQGSKRRKKDNHNINAIPVDRPIGDPRLVVQTRSEVDIVNDGYRWRKYGQKLVKGNPNPRNYYRCSSSGCPVKKHVERASHDPKLVITTYEGRHDHDMPPSRTVTHNTGGPNISAHNGESRTKLEENDAACHDMVVYSSSDPPAERLNGESRTKSAGLEMIDEKQNGELGTKSEQNNTARRDMVVQVTPACPETSYSEQEQKPKAESVRS